MLNYTIYRIVYKYAPPLENRKRALRKTSARTMF